MNWNDSFQCELEGFFKSRSNPNDPLSIAISYALSSPGKRLRPKFAYESAHLCGLDLEPLLPFAIAIELVHLFSLIHDDLPCMDNDDFRRGLPTVHKKFGEASALLAGDALLALAFEAFSLCAIKVDALHFVSALRFFSRSIGIDGMIGGQSKELHLGANLHIDELVLIQDLKTGALFRAALLVPLILKGIDETQALYREILKYASDFSFAFQIADDLEDEKQDQIKEQKNSISILGRKTAINQARTRLVQTRVSKDFSATEFLLQKLK